MYGSDAGQPMPSLHVDTKGLSPLCNSMHVHIHVCVHQPLFSVVTAKQLHSASGDEVVTSDH